MRIVHASDWHGRLIELPAADAYVFSGDMMPNFPVMEKDYALRLWRIDPAVERVKQTEWLAERRFPHRGMLASPDVPIVCVRGNHDFIDAADLFPGADVTEFIDNEVREILGWTFTGHRGIPWIHGSWNDEVHRPDLIDRMKRMPQANVYVTHYPPWGILDAFGFPGHEDHYGLEEMAYRLIGLSAPPDDWPLEQDAVRALHLFGHIHECGGATRQEGNVLFSNAATTFNVIDL
jgi:Icc-related predicted phosphoesterase